MTTRRNAAVFLDNPEGINGATSRRDWVANWTSIGDAHCLDGELHIEKGAFDEATEAWLCALTAFEVARRLTDEGDPQSRDVSAKVEAGIQRFRSLEQKVERVRIPCCDQPEFSAYYLPSGVADLSAPAVICISREEETGATLLGRLLPVVIGRGMSVLVVSHGDVSNHWLGQTEILSCCLDYLSASAHSDEVGRGFRTKPAAYTD